MIDRYINFVIRPPRVEYNPEYLLWDKDFTLAGREFKRQDLELTNTRGHTLRCSHYVPASFSEDSPLPCVVYCHGNSGCRADANEAVVTLLASNITVFALDFSGSGLSDGEFVSLGWHEKDDLKVVVSHLRNNNNVSCIGLWGRSMGAVTSLLYGAEDPSIAGMVLDSAFSNLFDLMMELVNVYKVCLPKFTVKIAVQYMRWAILKKANFDIMNLNCVKVSNNTFIPSLFGHANGDKFIQPHHSQRIFDSYAGDKNLVKFDGHHNTPRPQCFYDSVSIFFFNVLRPPQRRSASSILDRCINFGELHAKGNLNEVITFHLAISRGTGNDNQGVLREIMAGLRSVCADSAISSAPPIVGDSNDDVLPSYNSSNRDSFGRCSTFERSDESAVDEAATSVKSVEQYRRGFLRRFCIRN